MTQTTNVTVADVAMVHQTVPVTMPVIKGARQRVPPRRRLGKTMTMPGHERVILTDGRREDSVCVCDVAVLRGTT